MTRALQKTAVPASPELRDSVSGWMEAIAPYGIFTTDLELRIQSWNQWLVTQSGLAAAQVVGRKLTEVFPDLEQRRLLPRFTRALAGEISVLSTALHKYLLPFPVTVENSALPYMLQTARIAPLPGLKGISGTIIIIEDVTQREFQAGTLRRQQELDRLLSTALAALLQTKDPAQDIAKIFVPLTPPFGLDAYFCYLWQPVEGSFHLHAASGILPKQRETMALLPIQAGDKLNAKGAPLTVTATIAAHLRALEALGLKARSCWPLVIGDRVLGFVSFGSYQSSAISDADGNLLFRIAHFLAVALDRATKENEAVAASRAKDDFLAALSHELRTPLNPVLLIASDSANNPDFPAAARAAFRDIEKNAQLEARLIDDLLDLTRIEHGKLSLELHALDAHIPVRDAIATVRPDADAKKIALQVDLHALRSTVQGDAARLQQVFWNVLKNGIKFTPAGGQLWVSSSLDEAAQAWSVAITDNGIGMEPHELLRIFDAFTQGDHAGKSRGHRFGGLGLGLAICQKLVELHGGRIEAASSGRDQGSTFRIHFPLANAVERSPSGAKAADSGPSAAPEEKGRTPARLLLVEDHDSTRTSLGALLVRRGYAVTAASSATAALELAAQASFDLVLSDIGLPDIDGFALMRMLNDKYGVRGIALTGYGMEADMANSTAAGFVAHLTKPINIDVLDRTLKATLEQRARIS